MRGSADGVGTAAGLGSQGDIASDGHGALFVADTQNSAIRKVAVATKTVTTEVGVLSSVGLRLGPLPGGLVAPLAVATDASGAIYIGDDNAVLVAR